MKIRNDFVTNSSSSSFIISKDIEQNSIDGAYEIIRNLYIELDKKMFLAVDYAKNDTKGIFKYDESTGFKFDWHRIDEDSNFVNTTGLNPYDLSYWKGKTEWAYICNTYQEYQDYWLNKISKVHAPFTIGDYLNPEITWLHWGEGKTTHLDTGETNEEIEWYFDDYYDDYDKEAYETAKAKGNMCFELLGRFCIYSESGYINPYVVDKLQDFCSYSCNHMG